MISTENIHVTKTFLPPEEEYQAYLKQIWSSGTLTNQGPLLKDFEQRIKQRLEINNFHLVTNGTLALQLALRALDITEGEVITTPFTYVATTSAILWERCTPVFVDINPLTLGIDTSKIEASITRETKAILAVHVFGTPCDIEAIEAIAEKHNLKVIYDAAHAFGVEYKGKSLLDFGDISICSFHATKLFHTIEGGGLIVKDDDISERVELLKRFGHNQDDHIMAGMNAKASEFQAAMGLCNLKYIDDNIAKRKVLAQLYDELLGNRFEKLAVPESTKQNYGYYPVLAKNNNELLSLVEALNQQGIFPRRYFYPSLNTLQYLPANAQGQNTPVAEDITQRVMCLPLYADLQKEIVSKICEVLNK
jgi:dTDP-4-amino-4,6-dideoxygalactose transaminase